MISRLTIHTRLAFALCLSTCVAPAAEFALKVVEKEGPSAIDASIRALLKPQAIQLLRKEKPVYELWFRNEIPLKAKPDSPRDALKAIAATLLIGAAEVHTENQRDYKDDQVYEGIYTMRFDIQPQDGAHLGTTLYPYFAILVPAKDDTKPDAITRTKKLSRISGADTSSGHPVVLSLRPAEAEENLPKLVKLEEEDHRAIRLSVNGKLPDGGLYPLTFDFVFTGHGKID